MQSFDSFGRLDRRSRDGLAAGAISDVLRSGRAGQYLPFGNGRSYGDSCHNDAGVLADFRGDDTVVSFDQKTGVLEAHPGIMLWQIIDLCAPHGWFLPVTPGTRHVTLGGAVANDVHGKNHHRRGSFCCHVEALTLLRSNGIFHLDRSDKSGLFAATIGGMGLTGCITKVTLQLMRIGSLNLVEQLTPFDTLNSYFDQAEAADRANEYAVAWLDQIHGERGVLMTANHNDDGNFNTGSHLPKIGVPFDLPFNALNALSLRAFNAAFNFAKRRKAGRDLVSGYQGFFYPLDAVGNWNRLYGPRGLFQHQSVIPFEAAREVVPALLAASRKAGQLSFLTVLKRFGDVASPGVMSFPVPGYTLTLDFPNKGAPTLALLDELDAITIGAGGRVNPYKDARMSAATFAKSFPNFAHLEAHRDPAICSDFWRRTALKALDSAHFNNQIERKLTKVS